MYYITTYVTMDTFFFYTPKCKERLRSIDESDLLNATGVYMGSHDWMKKKS